MEVTLQKKETTARLKVNITEDDYKPKVAEKVKEYSKQANLKGFRPGKVPPGLIHKMYGKSLKAEEINKLVSSSVNNYIKENNLRIVGEPMPSQEENKDIDWENQKEFSFTFDLGLVPEFNLTVNEKIKISKFNIKITDQLVKDTVENLRDQFGEMKEVDIIEGDKDFLHGDLKKTGEEKSSHAHVSLENLNKAGQKLFKGKKKDDIVEFEIDKIFDDPVHKSQLLGVKKEEAEKQSGKYSFSLSKIQRPEKAEVNQQLFDKAFGPEQVKSEKEFIEKLKETIKENYKRETEILLDNKIHDHFVENIKMDLPEDFLKTWLYESNERKFSMEDIEKEFERFKKGLKWNLIRNKIVEDNELKVENEEVVNKAKSDILQQFGGQLQGFGEEMNETLNQIAENYLKQDNGTHYMDIYDRLMFEKALDFIKKNVTIQEKEVSLDDFKKEAGIS